VKEKQMVQKLWEREMQAEIENREDAINKTSCEIKKLTKERDECKGVLMTAGESLEVQRKATALSHEINALNEKKKVLEQELINIRKKQELNYIPSVKLHEIQQLKDSIKNSLGLVRNQLEAAQKERSKVVKELNDIEEKRDIAEEYNGNVSNFDEPLQDAKSRLEKVDADIAKLLKKADIIEKASDARYVINKNIKMDTPGYQLNRLIKELYQETEGFCKDAQHQRDKQFRQINNILQDFFSALTELGKIEAKVNLRLKEIEEAGQDSSQLKALKEVITFNGNGDWLIDYYKIISAFNQGKELGV
jgi:predicted  nucleic acid-binding Zn-ribbon protein